MPKRFIFEHRRQPVLPYDLFLKRMLNSFIFSMVIVSITIFAGTLGYYYFEHQSWVDALVNAVMIMTGLGLQGNLQTDSGKFFTAVFALLSAVGFYSSLAILFTPLLHRFLHHFHLDKDDQ